MGFKMNIELLTVNKQNGYNLFDVNLDSEGLSLRDDELADNFIHGNMEKIDIDNFFELELGNGESYGKIYVKDSNDNIENNEYFYLLKDSIEELGTYLDEITYEALSKEEEKDRDDYIEYHTKNG